jgi:hypothetical protein
MTTQAIPRPKNYSALIFPKEKRTQKSQIGRKSFTNDDQRVRPDSKFAYIRNISGHTSVEHH